MGRVQIVFLLISLCIGGTANDYDETPIRFRVAPTTPAPAPQTPAPQTTVSTLCAMAPPASCATNTPPSFSGTCTSRFEGASCVFSCASGYCASATPTYTCSCGAWCYGGKPPVCTAAVCPVYANLGANQVVGTCTAGGTLTSTCQLGCQNGYGATNIVAGTCSAAGTCAATWQTPSIVCTAVNCPIISPPSNGGVGDCTSKVLGSICDVTCNSGYVASGTSRATCTAGSGASASWTGNTLTCTPANCAAITATAPKTIGSCGVYALGSTCTQSCINGYSANPTTGTCIANGVGAAIWSGYGVTCTAVPCGAYTAIAPAAAGSCASAGNLGDKCTMSCQTGYSVSSSVDGTCTGVGLGSSAWQGQSIVCTAVTCNAPSVLAPQTIGSCNTGGTQGNTCSLSCSAGYVVSSASTATCQPCGVGCAIWTPVSVTCTLATCPALTPSNPQLVGNCTIGGVQGTICYLACANGYSVSGSTKGVCTPGSGQTASWLNAAITCTPVNCAAVTGLTAGQLQNNCTSKPLGTTCKLACDNGYVPSNIVQGTCTAGTGPTASWSGQSIICSAAYCSAATGLPAHAITGTCTSQILNSICSLDCASTYSASPGSSRAGTCVPGVGPVAVWVNQDITCVPGGCSSVTASNPQTVGNCTAQPLNAVCLMGCVNGYVRSGAVTSTCDGTNWVPAPSVTCTAAKCAAPSPPSSGTIGSCVNNANQGSICYLACNDGYVPSSNTSGSCSADAGPTASWKSQGLVCTPAQCAPVTGLTGGRLAGNCLTAALLASCNLQCDNGYVPSNSVAGKCTAQVGPTAVWTNHSITCTPANCAPVTPPSNALVGNCTTQALFATCLLRCQNGYVPSGAVAGVCTANAGASASWVGQVISCNAAYCSAYSPLPANATVGTCSPQSLGSTCQLSCKNGYVGTGTVGTCVNGTGPVAMWSGIAINCPPANCATVTSLPSNAVAGSCTTRALGAVCALNCANGYSPSGSVSGQCNATGPGTAAWAGHFIVCTPVNCNAATGLPANALVGTCGTAALSSSCQLTCKAGYSASNINNGICSPGTGPSASWAGQSIICSPVNCSTPATLPASAVAGTCDNKVLGSSCDLSCTAGFAASNSKPGVCVAGTGPTAVWNNASITCTALGTVCFTYTNLPENANAGTCLTRAEGSTCQLGCENGYVATSITTGRCNSSIPVAVWIGPDITCEPVPCTPAAFLPGHALVGSCGDAPIGTACNLTCADGYNPTGVTEGRCVAGSGPVASWVGQSVNCLPSICPAAAGALIPQFGTIGTCVESQLSAVCSLQCVPGSMASGSGTLTCTAGVGATASWVASGSLTCTPSTCSTTTSLPLNGRPGNCTLGALGTTCILGCANGYQMTNPVQGTCVGNGDGSASWFGADGGCTAVSCAPATSLPDNAVVGTCGIATLGASCSLACADGYSAAGSSPGTCSPGMGPMASWENMNIICQLGSDAALVGKDGSSSATAGAMGGMLIPVIGAVVGLCLILTVIVIAVLARRRKKQNQQFNDDGTVRVADGRYDHTVNLDATNIVGVQMKTNNPLFNSHGSYMSDLTTDMNGTRMDSQNGLASLNTLTNPTFSIHLEDSMQMKNWDEFTVLKELGAGAFGVVYHVREKSTFTDMALKVFKNVRTPDEVASFCREANVLLNLHHQHCLACFGLMQHDNELGLLMEFMSGGDLKSAMGKLNKAKKLTVLSDACKGLAYLHTRNLVHGDIKPGNILLDGYGVAKLADFGVTGASGLGFTERYAAPEVLRGDSKPSASSDVYSYGLTIVEVFSGKQPFEKLKSRAGNMDAAPYDKLDAVPASIRPVVERCLNSDPPLRPTPAEIIGALSSS